LEKKIGEEMFKKIMNDPKSKLLEYLKYDSTLGRE
jgi:hypothetical protein